MDNNLIGRMGEDIALNYLLKKGYILLDRNFNIGLGEIDLIFSFDIFLIFVEVKYRKNIDFGYPRDFVTITKQKKIIKASEKYMDLNNLYDLQPRFDIIEIIGNENKIEHIISAFP